VRFVRGTCDAEHGTSKVSLAAMDSEGIVYVLDSPSAFAFLTSRHPPVGLSATTAVDYARWAAMMSGALDPASSLVLDVTAVPDSITRLVTAAGGTLSPSRVIDDRAQMWAVALAGYTPRGAKTMTLGVEKRGGGVIVLSENAYAAPLRTH
jgi:hypothetical protein